MSTTFGASCVLAVIAVAGFVAIGTGMLIAQHRAVIAADMTALSAATSHITGNGDACEIAGVIAEDNGAHLQACSVDGDDVTVTVSVARREAEATAGPVD